MVCWDSTRHDGNNTAANICRWHFAWKGYIGNTLLYLPSTLDTLSLSTMLLLRCKNHIMQWFHVTFNTMAHEIPESSLVSMCQQELSDLSIQHQTWSNEWKLWWREAALRWGCRVVNEPSRSLKFYHFVEGPYLDLLSSWKPSSASTFKTLC